MSHILAAVSKHTKGAAGVAEGKGHGQGTVHGSHIPKVIVAEGGKMPSGHFRAEVP